MAGRESDVRNEYDFSRNADGSFVCVEKTHSFSFFVGFRRPDSAFGGPRGAAAVAAEGGELCASALQYCAENRAPLCLRQKTYLAAEDDCEAYRIASAIDFESIGSVRQAEAAIGNPSWGVRLLTLDAHVLGDAEHPQPCIAHGILELSPISFGDRKPYPPFREPPGWPAGLPPPVPPHPHGGDDIITNPDVLGNPYFGIGSHSQRPLTLREGRYLLKQLLTAVQAAHERRRVHLRLLPEQLIVWGCSTDRHTAVEAAGEIDGVACAVMVDDRLAGLAERMPGAAGGAAAIGAEGGAGGKNPFVCRSLPFPAEDKETRYVWVKVRELDTPPDALLSRDLEPERGREGPFVVPDRGRRHPDWWLYLFCYSAPEVGELLRAHGRFALVHWELGNGYDEHGDGGDFSATNCWAAAAPEASAAAGSSVFEDRARARAAARKWGGGGGAGGGGGGYIVGGASPAPAPAPAPGPVPAPVPVPAPAPAPAPMPAPAPAPAPEPRPEDIRIGGIDPRCDVFSAGAIFYTLMTGQMPDKTVDRGIEDGRFPRLHDRAGDPRFRVVDEHGHERRLFGEGSPELDLLVGMTRKELAGPRQRFTVAQALAHPFFHMHL